MATVLHIAARLHVTPLLDIQHPLFEKLYHEGVSWSLFQERCPSPLTDCYLLEHMRASLKETNGEGQQMIGFHLGRLHGAILSPDIGSLRPDVTALVSFQNKQTARGYRAGRGYYFTEAEPDECRYTDTRLIAHLYEIERESVEFQDEAGTWYFTLGCILGELSGPLFPATSEEYAHWNNPLIERSM